jgi:hypothetical protein
VLQFFEPFSLFHDFLFLLFSRRYLKKRQGEWQKIAEENRKKEELLRQAPAGFTVMPDADRLETLEHLKKS